MLSGDNGILQRVTDAKANTDNAQIKERIQLAYHSALAGGQGSYTKDSLEEELEKEFGENNYNVDDSDNTNWILSAKGQSVTIPAGKKEGGDETPKGPNGKPLVNQTTIAEITETKIVGEDKFGNQVVIPAGFKLAQGANGSGDCVKDGIVIEDSIGNQYVWIPVSNIDESTDNPIIVDDDGAGNVTTAIITLGRYTFDTSTGEVSTTTGTYQLASSYATPEALGATPTSSDSVKYYQELPTYRVSNGLGDTTGTNTTARGIQENIHIYNGIKGFIDSVEENKGYYIARYEASYREVNGTAKAGSMPSTSSAETLALTSAPSTRTTGDLWNLVTQREATNACYDLYNTINSDLMNSYAWDTAIVYIQAMGNTNYANANRGSNTTLKNTGDTGDEKCKIFDMAGNEYEWTTEYSTKASSNNAYPCVIRGGGFGYSNDYTKRRYNTLASNVHRNFSFRPVLYL